MTFEDKVIENTINKLLEGKDYREEIINTINIKFLDFSIDFFKRIVNAKFNNQAIDLGWYKNEFIDNEALNPDEIAINSGIKTITNICGNASKTTVIDVSKVNYEYLIKIISELKSYENNQLDINIIIRYNNISVNLNLIESLIVINTLATKKIALRGGAWSSIGKKVEKPLVDKLCDILKVPLENRDNKFFVKDKNKDFDREIDYKLISKLNRKIKIEVKLMGKGNPESADAVIARDTNIFIADTLSEQNKNQLSYLGVEYLELKNNKNIKEDFKKILDKFLIPNS